MKRFLVLALLAGAVILMAGPAFAASGVTLDGSLIFATEPVGGFDSTIGIGIGALLDMTDKMKVSSKDLKLGLRADLSYFDWEGDSFGVDISYQRFVLFGGPRFTFQPGGGKIAPYAEGGLELAYSRAEVYMPFFGTSSTTDINIGLAGGAGIDFLLTPTMKLGVNARLHLISDSFMTLAATFGVAF